MRDNKRGTIEDRNFFDGGAPRRIPVEYAEADRERKAQDAYIRLSALEGVLERLLARLSNATDLADVNIAAGIAGQELSRS